MPQEQLPVGEIKADNNPSLTLKQFATSIRNKYPDSKLYKEKSDLELSKAFINSDPKYKVYQDRIKDWPTEWPITPKNQGTGQQESFIDTMKRAADAGKHDKLAQDITNDPKKMNEYLSKSIKEAPWGKGAAAYGGAVALPFALAEIGNTLFGRKVVRDILTGRMKKLPSLAQKVYEHLKQPGTIVKSPFGRAIEYYLLSKIGVSKSTINKLLDIPK